MNKAVAFLCWIVAWFLVGCNGQSQLTPINQALPQTASVTASLQPTSTRTPIPPSPTATETPSPTVIPTATNTATIAPTSTTTFSPETRLTHRCLDVVFSLPASSASGKIVFQKITEGDTRNDSENIYLLDLETGQTTYFIEKDENMGGYSFSPDRKHLAFYSFKAVSDYSANGLIIVTADGQRQTLIMEDDWSWPLSWSDNQQLVIGVKKSEVEDADTSRLNPKLLVINPFSNEQKIIWPEFPRMYNPLQIDDYLQLPFWEGWQGVVYSPSLTRAVYLRFEDDENFAAFALWDMEQQKLVPDFQSKLAVYSYQPDTCPMPLWSPDGLNFVYPAIELQMASRDGKTTQLTNLDGFETMIESSIQWSPDGRRIALFLEGEREKQARLVVLDIETKNITDYCLPISYEFDCLFCDSLPPSAPIWSPDGKQLLIEDRQMGMPIRTLLVDIERGYVTEIADGVYPLGWMVSP